MVGKLFLTMNQLAEAEREDNFATAASFVPTAPLPVPAVPSLAVHVKPEPAVFAKGFDRNRTFSLHSS